MTDREDREGVYRAMDAHNLTCVDPEDTGDIAMVICANGPGVPAAVAKLVRHAVEFDKTGVISGD